MTRIQASKNNSALTDLRSALTDCVSACVQTTKRAIDVHLRAEVRTASGQIDILNARVGRYVNADKSPAASTGELIDSTLDTTTAMDEAQNDQAIDSALVLANHLCGDLREAFPAFTSAV